MSTSQLQQTTANLRISLAEIEDRGRQLESMIAQFRTQLRRLPRQVIYGPTGLDASLSALGEIEERLADATATRHCLEKRHSHAFTASRCQIKVRLRHDLEVLFAGKKSREFLHNRATQPTWQAIPKFQGDERITLTLEQELFYSQFSTQALQKIRPDHTSAIPIHQTGPLLPTGRTKKIRILKIL